MNWITGIVYAIYIGVFLTCLIVGFKNGLIESIKGFITYILSFAAANTLFRFVSIYVIRLSVFQKMTTEMEMPALDGKGTFLDNVKAIFRYFTENEVLARPKDMSAELHAIVNNYIAELLSSLIAFVAVFFAVLLLLKFVLWIVGRFVDGTPGLKQTDRVLGGAVGLINGLFWTWMFSGLFTRFVLPFLSEKWPDIFPMEIADIGIVRFCLETNPISYLFALINQISF